jgi:hypothetical protein
LPAGCRRFFEDRVNGIPTQAAAGLPGFARVGLAQKPEDGHIGQRDSVVFTPERTLSF